MNENITLKELTEKDCGPALLGSFNRYQKVERCWRMVNGQWTIQNVRYTEDWDETEKLAVAAEMRDCLKNGGRAVGIFCGDKTVGFASLEPAFFGSEKQYLDLALLHVSYEHRGKGYGRQLFAAICEQARQMNAKKLYISAHSAEDSMAFYQKCGCVFAHEINADLAEKEPFDCQLEYVL